MIRSGFFCFSKNGFFFYKKEDHSVISVQNVKWIRNGETILQDVNWQVQQGEHWAVLGMNGSGKTSLMNMVGGYEWPSKGQVSVLGNRYGECDLREVRKEIGIVNPMMDQMLHHGDKVNDIVVSGYYASIGIYEKVTDEVLHLAKQSMEQMGIAHLAEKSFGVLSQGERKKTLIARALINQPKLLILDEPCSGFDMNARETFLLQLNKLSSVQPNLSIIYVTHHIEEILPFIGHTLLMKGGKVLAAGKKEEVLTSENISHTYDIDVKVTWFLDRPYVQVR
jgi:iron complex transport system ATP-binding protein